MLKKSLFLFMILSSFSTIYAQKESDALKEKLEDVLEKISKHENSDANKKTNPLYPTQKDFTKEKINKLNPMNPRG